MKLHHHPMSSSARRAVLTAVHLGVPFDSVVVDLTNDEARKKLLVLNPNGKVPVLEDGDLVLWESHAIMQYLADKTPGQTVYPTDLKARADVNRWLFWGSAHFYPAAGILNWENLIKPMIGAGATDPAEVARGERLFGITARVLDEHLANREWISGPRLTLADLAIAPVFITHERAKMPLAQYKNIVGWFDRVRALECWKKTDL
jgi:glutathione S-transferase